MGHWVSDGAEGANFWLSVIADLQNQGVEDIFIACMDGLSGSLVGALVYRLLDFGLRRYIGEGASFVNGAIYILIVLFLPYGIVGTWRMKRLEIGRGRGRLKQLFFGG